MIALLLLFVKSIFGLIDSMVVFVIKYLYQLIIAIADTNVFGNVIYHYLGRIYVFLGIFMVFKLSISMINYIINPDALTDKSKGFGKLISNVIISLILLVATPTLFTVAFDIQEDILTSNAIYQIVTGRELSAGTTKQDGEQKNSMYDNAVKNANSIAYGVYRAFVYNSVGDVVNNPICDKDDAKEKKYGCKSVNSVYRCPENDVNCLLANSTITNDDNTYWWLLSTAVGLVVAYILLTFCFDIAIRSVKLGFLQIIAPIPIMMRMDPGAKDDKFSKWLKEVGSTFASLFIRLAGLFFVIEIIGLVMEPTNEYGMMSTYSGYEQQGLLGIFVKLFIIIGCLMFAKKLPQLISDLFGIKLDGDGFSLKKKMGNIPGLGAAKVLGAGALGFAGGMAANAWAGAKGWDKNKSFLGNINKFGNSMMAGGLSGAFRGATSKEKNMFKAAGAGITGAAAARNLRADRFAAGDGGLKGYARRTGVAAANLAGIPSGASKYDKQLSAYDSFLKQHSTLDSYIEGEIAKNKNHAYDNIADLKNKIETLKSAGVDINRSDYIKSDGTFDDSAYNAAYEAAVNARSASITQAEYAYNNALKQAKIDYVDAGTDTAVTNMISEMNYIRENNSTYEGFSTMGEISSGADWDSSKGKIKAAQSDVKVSDDYRQAQINKKNDAKK